MALTEYRGKVMGYAYSTFIVNDTLYYIVKRVKGVINGNICEVEDVDVITNNFPKKPEKGVNVIYTFRRNITDSTWTLDGNWKTNATKKYYSISGNVQAKEEKDLSKSKLYEHLGDLNLQNTLAFNKPNETKQEKKAPKDKDDKKDIAKVEVKKPVNIVSNPPKQEAKTEIVKAESKTTNEVVKTDVKKPDALVSIPPKQEVKTEIIKSEAVKPESKFTSEVVKTDVKKPEPLISISPKQETNDEKKPVLVSHPPIQDVKTDVKKSEALVSIPPKQEAKTEIAKVEEKKPVLVSHPPIQDVKTDVKKPETLVSIPPKQEAKTEIVKADEKKPVLVSHPPIQDVKTEAKQTESKSVNDVAKTTQKQPDNNSIVNNSTPVSGGAQENKTNTDFVFSELKRTNKKLKPASELVEGRESIPSETIFFKSDSLVLALYDNGEVDGDTVSVIMNGELIIEKQGLKSAAFKKTIYLSPDEGDSVLLVLYADNLGIYPPNTGLLIVKDGDESFYVRFKADFDRNAAILLRKKLK